MKILNLINNKELLFPIDYKLVGKTFHFFDDGKKSEARQYYATVVNLLTPSQAKEKLFEFNSTEDNSSKKLTSLYNEWLYAKKEHNWLFDEETPYFIVCTIKGYSGNDNDLFYFVKKKNSNNYFNFDFKDDYWEGELDLTGFYDYYWCI